MATMAERSTDRSTEPVRLLFVCLGNICRSPTAEAVMAHHLATAGLTDAVEVDSAGTGGWHAGDRPDERATEEASRRGIAMHSRARQVHEGDFAYFDLILAMDAANLADLRALAPDDQARRKVRLLRSFDPDLHRDGDGNGDGDGDVDVTDLDVPDPYYGGPNGFRTVFDLVDTSCRGLLEYLKLEQR